MRIAFTVHGRVQGVGFRYYVKDCAQRLGLAGFVRNHWDGTVQGEAAGETAILTRLRLALEAGNSYSRVSHVLWEDVAEKETPLPFPFEIKA